MYSEWRQHLSSRNTGHVTNPSDVLDAGAAVLSAALEPFGYVMEAVETGKSSGGRFAVGRWRAGSRTIETHVRYGLGIVEYKWGALTLSHADYLRTQGVKGEYPGFGKEPADGFVHLAADLRGPARGLLECTHDEFAAVVRLVDALPTRWLP